MNSNKMLKRGHSMYVFQKASPPPVPFHPNKRLCSSSTSSFHRHCSAPSVLYGVRPSSPCSSISIEFNDQHSISSDEMNELICQYVSDEEHIYSNLSTSAIFPLLQEEVSHGNPLWLDRCYEKYANGSCGSMQEVSECLGRIGSWEFDVLELAKFVPNHTLVFVGLAIFQSPLVCNMNIAIDLDILEIFLLEVQSKYRKDVAYHNADHASDVLHSLYCMINNDKLQEILSSHVVLALLLSAIIHDIGHFGCSNNYLKETGDSLTEKYIGDSVLEMMHSDIGITILKKYINTDEGLLFEINVEKTAEMFMVIHEAILATDLKRQQTILLEFTTTPIENMFEKENMIDQLKLLRLCLHIADLGHTWKPFAIHNEWVLKLNQEFDSERQLLISKGYSCSELSAFHTKNEEQVLFLKLVITMLSTINQLEEIELDYPLQMVMKNANIWLKTCVFNEALASR